MTTARLALGGLALFLLGTLASSGSDRAVADKKADPLVYELRTYTTHPGKLPALHKRFDDHTMQIFRKHGIKNVIYWTPSDPKLKNNTLVYLIAHKSRAAANRSWAAFREDPDWQAAFKASRKNGPLVKNVQRQFLVPTDYSPMK